MQYKKLRDLVFSLHRYIGLAVSLLLIVVGLTGSLLVFQKEIDHFLIRQQFGPVIPQEQRVSIESVLDTVKAAYANRPDLKVYSILALPEPDTPYIVRLTSPADTQTQVLVNPYTGKILGSRQWEHTFIGVMYELHYALLAGEVGIVIVGIAALLLLILCITCLILWPGWRKLISGFKIKWNAHPKRVNFDIHKVVGIVTIVFLALTAFTGFCWNFADFTEPVIYAATLTPKPPVLVSRPTAGKASLGLDRILRKADTALPGAVTTYISLPEQPEGIFEIGKKFPQEVNEYGESEVILDQYSGEVLQVRSGLEPSRAEQVLNSFVPLHYGTFWGLPSRVLYVFVGLAPLILFVTGSVMWHHRYRGKAQIKREIRTHPRMRRLFSIKSIKGSFTQKQAGSRRNL